MVHICIQSSFGRVWKQLIYVLSSILLSNLLINHYGSLDFSSFSSGGNDSKKAKPGCLATNFPRESKLLVNVINYGHVIQPNGCATLTRRSDCCSFRRRQRALLSPTALSGYCSVYPPAWSALHTFGNRNFLSLQNTQRRTNIMLTKIGCRARTS